MICVSSYPENEYVIFECTHKVCIRCFEKLIQQDKPCPFCRANIDTSPTPLMILIQPVRPLQEELIIEEPPFDYRACCCKWLLPAMALSTILYVSFTKNVK